MYYDFIFSEHSKKVKIVISSLRIILPIVLTFYSLTYLKELDTKTISQEYLDILISGGLFYLFFLYIAWNVLIYVIIEQFCFPLVYHPLSKKVSKGLNNMLEFFKQNLKNDNIFRSFSDFIDDDITYQDLEEGEYLGRSLLVLTLQITLLSFLVSSQYDTVSFLEIASNVSLTILSIHFALNYISILAICFHHENKTDEKSTNLLLITQENTSTSKGDKLMFDYMYKNSMPNKND